MDITVNMETSVPLKCFYAIKRGNAPKSWEGEKLHRSKNQDKTKPKDQDESIYRKQL